MTFDATKYKYEVKSMPWHQWKSSFLPQRNKFQIKAAVDGMLLVPEGVEWNYTVGQYAQQLWTLSFNEKDGKYYLSNGLYVMGRVGYIVCERMHNPREIWKVELPQEFVEGLPARNH
jgi:hypothetical protein